MNVKNKIASTLTGLIIFSGIPLISWGIKGMDDFISNPVRLAYIIQMAILTVIVAVLLPEGGSSRGQGIKTMTKHKLSLAFLQVVPILIVFLAPYFDQRSYAVFTENNLIRWIGLGISFFGFVLMNWSVKVLDKQFSVEVTVQQNHQLITQGPYQYVRHPRYLGIIIFFTGVSLTFRSWLCLILVLATLGVLIWRIIDEEKLMHAEFKRDWETYKLRTYALLPFIY
jgi:protein-S-isoprenylcysteine O-methyltransferase Ste14